MRVRITAGTCTDSRSNHRLHPVAAVRNLSSQNVDIAGEKERTLMGWVRVSAAVLVAVASGSVPQPDDPILRPACNEISVSLLAEASQVKAGDRPRFSVTVSNNTHRSVRTLNVQDGRRPDLQDTAKRAL